MFQTFGLFDKLPDIENAQVRLDGVPLTECTVYYPYRWMLPQGCCLAKRMWGHQLKIIMVHPAAAYLSPMTVTWQLLHLPRYN